MSICGVGPPSFIVLSRVDSPPLHPGTASTRTYRAKVGTPSPCSIESNAFRTSAHVIILQQRTGSTGSTVSSDMCREGGARSYELVGCRNGPLGE